MSFLLLFITLQISAYNSHFTTEAFCELKEIVDEWVVRTTTVEGVDHSETIINNEFIVKVKIENQSKVIVSPLIIREKAQLIKRAIEAKYALEEVLVDGTGKATIYSYKTNVILDYTPQFDHDDRSIGHLVFIDAKSTSSTYYEYTHSYRLGDIKRTTKTTVTKTEVTKGSSIGRINFFKIYVVLTIDGTIVSDEELKNIAYHEFGHSASLNHPWELDQFEKSLSPELNQSIDSYISNKRYILANIMNSDENPIPSYRSTSGEELLQGQLEFMVWKISLESFYRFSELASLVVASDYR